MTANDFLEQFATLADAPSGIPKLRDLILQLAIQGKVAPQDAKDEPASQLLGRIKRQQDRMIREKIIRAPKVPDSIAPDETPFSLPSGWQWVRLGNIGDWGSGATPTRGNPEYFGGSIRWFKSGELNEGIISQSSETITEKALKDFSLRLDKPGDVLIAMYGATIGRVAILEVEATTNQAVCACTCFDGFYNRFLFLLLKAYKSVFISGSAGAAQPNFSKDKIIITVAPLPPLAEQKRIVAKVDRLMALCDALESQQQARDAVRSRLHATLLGNLQTAANAADFARAWQRLRDHFAELFTPGEAALDAVAQLRQTILQLAVQGKLVPQRADDEPAPTGLIRARKKRHLPAVDGLSNGQGNKPFDVPASWLWMTIGDVAESRLGKMLDQNKNKGTPYPYLRNTNVHWLRFDLSSIKEMPFEDNELDEYEVRKGDVLICEGGHGIARTAVWRGEMKRVMFQKALHRVQPFECLDSDFLSFCIKVYADSGFLEHYYTGAGIPHFTGRSLAKVIFPLPPLAEQQRIVAKVQQLMAQCEALEASLKAAATVSERWSAAAVRQLLADAS